MKKYLPLLIVIIIAAFIRFYNLGTLPVSPNWDEVSHGYNAYSILKTGKDEWGRVFPLIFRAFGDYKLPVYIYLTTIPVSLFGLNVFAIRFISALAGIFAIPGIYLLTRELFPSTPSLRGANATRQSHSTEHEPIVDNLPFLSALLLSISPWHFFISRPALEANLALTLIIFGAYFLVRFVNHKSSLLPAAIFFGLSLHTYNTARVFIPLLVIVSFLIFRSSVKTDIPVKVGTNQISPKFLSIKNILAIIFFSASLLLVVSQVLSGEGSARYEKLKILSPSIVYQIGETRAKSPLPSVFAKIVYNRPVTFITTVAKNYLGYFSPQFFYQTWGAQYQFAIPGQNLLSLPVYLLSIIGFLVALSSLRLSASGGRSSFSTKSNLFLVTWLFLSPVAASLTADPPQALRPNPMIPALIILASLGLFYLLGNLSQKFRIYLLVVILGWIVISFAFYYYNYRTKYKVKFSSSWQYGYSQVMSFIKEHSSEYKNVFITKRYGEPHLFYSFFTKLDPSSLQPGPDNIRFKKTDWFWTDKIDNVYFVNDWQIPIAGVSALPLESGGNISTFQSLLITSPDHVPVNAHVIETVKLLDGSPAFIITSIP